ncbi:ABC transporter ATP-binding protein [Victivallis sp. Marseille-Q1083]|uniref:ABC transporter ATP-binding protein n=1 Tax=Victivallis sp. Marseille-Q1083 TaxID=2717288 RepID=UPI00158A842F|nr:ABC transporter ATP-binding protein [Victivallis sp. Marseille-Q1083]
MKVEVKNLVRYFGDKIAVDNISFSFESGNIFGFIGPNGAGKTTTIKVMATLDLPTCGDVFYDGVSVTEYPDKIRGFVGFMPDALPEHSDIRVWEYLDFFARAYGLKGGMRHSMVRQIEEFTNLGELRDKFVRALSKGMKQRVCLARALIHNPEVLIMDEPAAGLDPRARLELRELLKILASQGKAILLSSHILSELQDMCDGAVIIERGKILSAGKLDDIVAEQTAESRKNMTVLVQCLGDPEVVLLKAQEMPLVTVARLEGSKVVLEISSSEDEACWELLNFLVKGGCRINSFQPQKLNLEHIFMKITHGQVQ